MKVVCDQIGFLFSQQTGVYSLGSVQGSPLLWEISGSHLGGYVLDRWMVIRDISIKMCSCCILYPYHFLSALLPVL